MTMDELHRPELAMHYPRVLLARAEARGAGRAELLQAAGLTEAEVVDDEVRVTPAQLGALLRAIWIALDDELSGFGAAPQRFGWISRPRVIEWPGRRGRVQADWNDGYLGGRRTRTACRSL